MREDQRLIAMEVESDMFVERHVDVLDRDRAVVVIPADEDPDVRRDCADPPDALRRDAVPHGAVFLLRNFVQKLERHHVRIVGKFLCDAFPQAVKPLLIPFAFKESRFALVCVKGKARRFVQVKDHVEPVFP